MKNFVKNSVSIGVFLLIIGGGVAQTPENYDPKDSIRYSLLINPFIQIESTEAINSMYNFEFDKAQSHFNYLQKEYPWHPLPYLLKSLNYWWRIVPDYKVEKWDEQFLAYIDTTKVLAENIYENYNEVEGAFFLAAAYAFEGRLYSERRWYRKAAFAGGASLKYLKECEGHETYSPELLFGDALFNYYAEWIREEYPLLRPVMMFFPKGDKEQGIRQLKEVAHNAFYSRTEAQYYLMRILSNEEGDIQGALQIGQYLHEQFPNNAYFHRYYARLLYQSGRRNECVEESLEILQQLDSGATGYEGNSGRYAGYFIGHTYKMQGRLDEAKKYYEIGLEYAEQVGAQEMGYYLFSLVQLGEIVAAQGDEDLAEDYFKRVKKLAKRKHPAHKEAREQLREL